MACVPPAHTPPPTKLGFCTFSTAHEATDVHDHFIDFIFLHMLECISCSIIDNLHLLESNYDGLILVLPHTEILPQVLSNSI